MTTQREVDFVDHAQADLFVDRPIDLPHQPIDTSEAAAESMRPTAGTIRVRVLLAIWRHGGLTQDQYEEMTGMPGNTARPRFWELERRALIEKTIERRQTRADRAAIVYQCTEAGRLVAFQVHTHLGDDP